MAAVEKPAMHENLTKRYLTGVYLLDPFYNLHVIATARGVYRLANIAPDQFQRKQYFIEYYRTAGMLDELAFVCYPTPRISIHLCLGNDFSSNSKFTNKMLRTANRISPIVTSLVEMHWQNLAVKSENTEAEISPNLIEAIHTEHRIKLTPRQAEVAFLILHCHSSESIAAKLGISLQTVKVFRKQLYKRCNISSQAELFNLLMPLIKV